MACQGGHSSSNSCVHWVYELMGTPFLYVVTRLSHGQHNGNSPGRPKKKHKQPPITMDFGPQYSS